MTITGGIRHRTIEVRARFAGDLADQGWTLVEDTPSPLVIDPLRIEVIKFMYRDSTHVSGPEMRRRAAILGGMLGQRQCEALIRKAAIPEEWRKYHLICPGTVWGFRPQISVVPFAYWNGGEWCIDYWWLSNHFRPLYCEVERIIRLT
jgi:hypothetical protein